MKVWCASVYGLPQVLHLAEDAARQAVESLYRASGNPRRTHWAGHVLLDETSLMVGSVVPLDVPGALIPLRGENGQVASLGGPILRDEPLAPSEAPYRNTL